MHPPLTPEKKEGMRELRDLQTPSFPRLAKIAGCHVTTVREIAARENWPKLHVPRGTVMRVARVKDLQEEAAGRERAELLAAMDGAADEPVELPPGDIGALVVQEMRAMLAVARHTGTIDKSRADALWSVIRVAERVGKLQPELGHEEEMRSDDELAEILARVDERIVELARDYAERLVAGQADAQGG
ncbi:MAG TPA: hypothetical protein VIZ90_19265 [Rhizobiaceae bacterium]